MPTVIERRPFSVGPGAEWALHDFTRRLRERLRAAPGSRVCEFGGGANPALDIPFIDEHELRCLVVDASESELAKAPLGYSTLVGDVGSPAFETGEHDGSYDLVFSRVVAEHVLDPMWFHRNARRLLRPGGIAMHFFPTLWWPPFVVNRVLPEALTERMLLHLDPHREKSGTQGKFPAYYRWCRGPTPSQLSRLASVGFSVEHCTAYFGEPTHAPGSALKAVDRAWTDLMMRRPSYLFTSYAAYTLRVA
jgi:SAM-dependent methyltransferase